MSSGDIIISEKNLRDRNEWLKAHKPTIEPFLKGGRDCVVFTFSRKSSSDRLATRVGGLPYWPKDDPWPVCGSCGEPLAFAAQIDFRHKSVRKSVPGDVLTFHYCFDCSPWTSDETEQSLLTWHNFDSTVRLIREPVVPSSLEDDEPGPVFGEPHEAIDYPTPSEAFGGSIIKGERYTFRQFSLEGTKIGGYPPPIQQVEIPLDRTGRPMRFLGTIGSLQVSELPTRKSNQPACGDLMWQDMGSIYLWLSGGKNPELIWFLLCY